MDLALVRWVNGWATRFAVIDALAIFSATGLIIVLAAIVVLAVWRLPAAMRRSFLIELIATAVIAYGASQFIGAIAFRERPFVRHPEIRLRIAKEAGSKSFPSDHATLAFVLTIPTAAAARTHGRRWIAALVFAMAIAVALGRVAVGVHYVSDVLAGAFLAWGAQRAVCRIRARA